MIPKRVTLENFLSFGPKTQIEFADGEPLWVLGGPNGVGKSAVFDAITYCLFGEHRGGAKEIDPLVRHGANGFSVGFEFEFHGTDYRVSRKRTSRKSTQSVERRTADGEWERVPHVDSVASVKAWAEETLGLNFDAFRASVLLRQGEADAILTATGTERLKILKKIIGAERYETLSADVHEATRTAAAALTRAETDTTTWPEIPDDAIPAAAAAAAAADDARQAARATESAAAAGIEVARRWVERTRELRAVEAALAAADARAANTADIRRRAERLADLEKAAPAVRELVAIRDRSADRIGTLESLRKAAADAAERGRVAGDAADAARSSIERHRDALERAESRLRQIETGTKALRADLSTAEAVAGVDEKLRTFPDDLDTLRTQAAAELTDATAELADADRNFTVRNTRREEAEQKRKEFDRVEAGATCARCRQPVTAEHAAREKAELAAAVEKLAAETRDAKAARTAAASRKAAAERTLTERSTQTADRDRLRTERATLLRNGEVPPVTELRDRIAADETARTELQSTAKAIRKELDTETAAAKQHDTTRKAADAEREAAEKKLRTAEDEQARDDARRAERLRGMPDEWISFSDTSTAGDVDVLEKEARTLAESGVRDECKALEADAALCEEWERQRADHLAAIDAVPSDSRLTVEAATAAAAAARRAARDRDVEYDSARAAHEKLTAHAAARAAAVRQLRAAETASRVHRKLDDLLGKQGLQRELVRDAESRIVAGAAEILHNLSRGDLAIELAPADAKGDDAFDVRVRRAESPDTTGVLYLSGSQRFRVAISVALAVGQFAAGQARPVECVIIDEGFGSLDRDGLRAAAEELNRLKDYLKRIILVSHQDEFTEHFPVVVRLSRGETGTIAETIRR